MKWLHQHIRKKYQTALLAAILIAPTSALAQDITSGLEAHWGFEEASGATQAADLSGNGNTAFFTSSDADNDFVKGVFGQAVSIDGTTDCLRTNTNNDAIDNLDVFTLALWVRPNNLPGVQSRLLSPGASTFDLQITSGNNFAFIVNTSASGGSNRNITSPALSTQDLRKWHHVAGTYDGTTMILYVNGKPVNSNAQTGAVNNGGNGFGIGNNATCGQPIGGLYDDVRVYDRALTPEDVEALYEAPSKSCEIQNRGSIIYNTDGQVMQYCDSSNWVAMGKQRYVPEAASFVSADSDSLTRGGNLTGIADTKRVTGSFWVKRTSLSGGAVKEIYSATSRFRITFDTGDNLRITGRNAADTSILSHSSAAITDSDWHHVIFSIDMENQADSHVYVDDVDVTNFFTFTDDFIDISASWHTIGANGGSNLLDAHIADFWLETDTYLDLSDTQNRRKFIDASGNPVDLGTNGEGPLGAAPDVFLSGNIEDWHTNKGTGGGFTENGALAAGIGPSKITGGVSNLSSIPACSTSSSAHSFSLAGTLPAANRDFLGLWVDPPYIFAGNGWMGGDTPFEVYTFDGTNFTVVDSVTSGHGFPENIWSDGTYYYLAAPGSGLYAYTFDGTDLTLVGSETTIANEARGPWGDGEYIYVADGAGGFHAFTFDGTTFTQAGSSLATSGFSLSVYSDGEFLYLGDGAGGLRIYTFNGTSWTAVDSAANNTRRIWDDQNFIYGIGSAGLFAYSFDGTTLTEIASETTGIGSNTDVWGDGQFIYAAGGSTNGVRVYDFNGTEFTLVDTYPSVNDMRSVAGDGTYIFAGDSNQGLYALNGFDCLQCTNPTGRAGDITYNTSTNQMQYCNAEQWVAMGPTGDGGAGCSNPGGAAGDIAYNTTYDRMQYCEGDEWIAIGSSSDCANIGDTCGDGTVYVGLSPDGNVRMYTQPADNTNTEWGDSGTVTFTTTSITDTVTGESNTSALVALDSDSGTAGTQQHNAAQFCFDYTGFGASDWYLPAEDELDVLYTNRNAGALNGTFDTSGGINSYYWTSTEQAADRARHTLFSSGSTNQGTKSQSRNFRCVRKD